MPNMSYCRMENTCRDLADCKDNWEDANSDSEKKCRKRLLELCKDIVEIYGDEEDEDE